MSGTQSSASRKRPHTDQLLPSPPPSKRLKEHQHSTGAFWDTLSKIWLTKDALVEFERRDRRPHSQCRQARSSATKGLLAEEGNAASATKLSKEASRFARHGGPDLSDLIGYPEPVLHLTMSSSSIPDRDSSLSETSITKSTTGGNTVGKKGRVIKKTSPYDANYQQKLTDGGVFPFNYTYPDGRFPPLPLNENEIVERLARRRRSMSPSTFPDEKFRQFVREDDNATNEDAVMDILVSTLLKTVSPSNTGRRKMLFTNIDPMMEDIARAKPDYYDGARPEQIHEQVRGELSSHIIPSGQDHPSAVPNFILEAKALSGSAVVVLRQACHDGAIGARAMQSLHSYKRSNTLYRNNAYTISATYHQGGSLKLYCHLVAQPNGAGTKPKYYMHRLGNYGIKDTPDNFRRGANALRNAMELCLEYRNDAIAQANEAVG